MLEETLAKAIDIIKKEEGLSLVPYKCPAGKLTIGYGTNLDCGISKAEAEFLLTNRINETQSQLKNKLPFYTSLSETRQFVLLDMAYNLGFSQFMKFKKMIAYLSVNKYEQASLEMINSAWYKQVGNRSKKLVEMMRSDKWL